MNNTSKFFTTVMLALQSSASAISIAIDYSHSTSGFFDTGSANGVAARAAVQAAANDVSNAITTNLATLSNYTHTGSSGGSSATIPATLGYANPDTGARESFTGNLAADEFRIFVGARALDVGILGQGGPGSTGVDSDNATGSAASDASFQDAVNIASASFTAEMMRGSSVLANSLSGDFGPANLSVSFGPTIGNLWFDNDGSSDFHLDHTTPVGINKVELYSVALHEIFHAIGIGTYASWANNVSGVDWLGSEVAALHGTGAGVIDADGGHIAANVMSTRLSDGAEQEVVMDPNIVLGLRKELTLLDLAFLRDLGFQTVPEPSSTLLLALGSLSLMVRRRK